MTYRRILTEFGFVSGVIYIVDLPRRLALLDMHFLTMDNILKNITVGTTLVIYTAIVIV